MPKISDISPEVQVLPEDALLVVENAGINNNVISVKNFITQIYNQFASQAISDSLSIKYVVCEDSGGIPINYPEHFLYLDGSTYTSSDSNSVLGKFINSVKDNIYFRNLFKIPSSNDSITVFDTRNLFIRSVGEATDLQGKLQNDGIPKITGLFHLYGAHSVLNTGAFKSVGAETYYNNTTLYTNLTPKIELDTSLLGEKFNAPEVRPKNMALFCFLDISTNQFTINPVVSTNISNIVGLQAELDSKQNISTLRNDINSLGLGVVIDIPISINQTINNTNNQILNFAPPVLKRGFGVVSDYVSLTNNNIIKILKLEKNIFFSVFFYATVPSAFNQISSSTLTINRVSSTDVVGETVFSTRTGNGSNNIYQNLVFSQSFIKDNTDYFYTTGLQLRFNNTLGQTATISGVVPGRVQACSLRITLGN